MRWSRLYALREAPIRKIVLPAAILIPVLAAAFEISERLSNPAHKDMVFSITSFEYSPLIFWYYISFLLLLAFSVAVDGFAPDLIKRYHDFDHFLLRASNDIKKLVATGDGYSTTKYRQADELTQSAQRMWNQMEMSNAFMRWIALALFGISGLIVAHGVFVYVPAKILKFDSIYRLFMKFFIVWQ